MPQMPFPEAAIGVFDSGLGGLTVAAAIAAALPSENLVYLGDTARVPYGSRSPATVVRYARKNVSFLTEHRVKLVVVACNTVSAQGLGGLSDGTLTPILGVIRPGARAALSASKGGTVAVIGTATTIRSNAYKYAIEELAPRQQVIQIPCPLFVPLVEEGWMDHQVTQTVADEYLKVLAGTDVDTLILGCTHYPLLRGVIEATVCRILGRPVAVVDSAVAVAEETKALVERLGRATLGPTRRFFVTDTPDRSQGVAAQFWGDVVGGEPLNLEHVDMVYEA